MTPAHWRGLRAWIQNDLARCRREMLTTCSGVYYAAAKARACVLDDVLQRMNHELKTRLKRSHSERLSAAMRASWAKRKAAKA